MKNIGIIALLRRNGRILYFISLGLCLTGFVFAFILPKILG